MNCKHSRKEDDKILRSITKLYRRARKPYRSATELVKAAILDVTGHRTKAITTNCPRNAQFFELAWRYISKIGGL